MNDIRYEVRDRVAEIGLHHPPVNALTEPMIDRLIAALQRAADDPAVRAVIVHGGVPERFCAGLDLKLLQGAAPESIRTLLDKLYPALTETQHRLGKPSIAAVEGSARGGGMTLGVGAGQMSRVDSTRIASIKAKNNGLSLAGSVAASDAFFPFRDGLDVVAKAGARAVIQPGGSVRDEEVIAAADGAGLAMVFTGMRHFRH